MIFLLIIKYLEGMLIKTTLFNKNQQSSKNKVKVMLLILIKKYLYKL